MVFIIGDTVRPLGAPGVVSFNVDDFLALVDADLAICQPDKYLLQNMEYRILLTSPPGTSKVDY